MTSASTDTPTHRLHMIRTAQESGEWWTVASQLSEARQSGDYLVVGGSWTAYLSRVPVSRMHAYRLLKIHDAGLACENHTYREALRWVTPKERAPYPRG